jgi:hypothetical protein
MANIRLKELLEANVDPKLVARSKESGKLVYFKTPQAKDAALKAGSHIDPKAEKGGQSKSDAKPNDMFGGDYSKDRGGEAPKADKTTSTPSKYDDTEYWKDDEYSNTQGYIDSEEDDDYDEEGSDVRLTSDRLSRVETALEGDLDLRGNGFETTRESSGGGGGWEGPMTIVSKDADYNSDDYISLSVGSPNNDGKFSIVFANANGEPHFEPNYDALTGDSDLEPQQAYKVTKALMKMPEVQKVLKGQMKMDEFKPIYDKLKSKFSKTESTKLTSMIKR